MNNIQKLLDRNGLSIRQMSIDLEIDYSVAHKLATRDSLDNIALKRLKELSKYFGVTIEELYEED